MKNIILFPVIVLLTLPFSVRGQVDTILLMKGKRIITSGYTIKGTANNDGFITYKNKAGKTKKTYLEDVFSVTDKNGVETVFYEPMPNDTNELSVDQMRWFLKGKADIGNWHFSTGYFAGGFVSGAAGAVCPPVKFEIGDNQSSARVGVLIPVMYLALIRNSNPTIEEIKTIYPQCPDNAFYLQGAQDAVRECRVKDGLKGTISGFIIGLMGVWAYNSEH